MQAEVSPGPVVRRYYCAAYNIQYSEEEGPDYTVGRKKGGRKARQRTKGRNNEQGQACIFLACLENGNQDDGCRHQGHKDRTEYFVEFLFVHFCKDSSIRLASGALPRKDAKSS